LLEGLGFNREHLGLTLLQRLGEFLRTAQRFGVLVAGFMFLLLGRGVLSHFGLKDLDRLGGREQVFVGVVLGEVGVDHAGLVEPLLLVGQFGLVAFLGLQHLVEAVALHHAVVQLARLPQ